MQPPVRQLLNTNEFARALGVQGNTIRRALCVKGHYLGLRPVKLPNHRLGWPAEDVDRVVRGEG